MIDQDKPMIFMDAKCPSCGSTCGNGGSDDMFHCCQCGWSGHIGIHRKPRFTEEEVADAKAILRILPHVDTVERMENGLLYCYDREMEQVNICGGLFPSLRPGQAVRLEEVVM